MKKILLSIALLAAVSLSWAGPEGIQWPAWGVYNATPPTLTDGKPSIVQLDSSGSVKINCLTGCSGGGGGSNAAAGATGSAVPAAADYLGFKDVSGNTLGVSAVNPLPTSITSLYYPSSTANNTTAQLAAGATFTGGIETILSLQAAQIEIVCDQPYTLVVNQYIDAAGTQKSGSWTITKAAGVPTNINRLLPGNYFNLTLTNNGSSATTTLVINTTFGIMDTVDDQGYLAVSVPPPVAIIANQQSVTASAVALPANVLLNSVVITALSTNTCTVYVGPAGVTTSTGYPLTAGQPIGYTVNNTNVIYVIGTTGSCGSVAYTGN